MYRVSTSRGSMFLSDNMLDIINNLPLFNNYNSKTIEESIENVLEDDISINDAFISAIKSGDPLQLHNLYLDDDIKVFVSDFR